MGSRQSQQSHQWTSTFLMVLPQHHPHMSRLSQQKNHRGTSTFRMDHRNHNSHCPTRSPLQLLVDHTLHLKNGHIQSKIGFSDVQSVEMQHNSERLTKQMAYGIARLAGSHCSTNQ